MTAAGRISFGTQSWSYPEWNGVFYDDRTRGADHLAQYAQEFPLVEADATFYGTPAATTIEKWCANVPAGFRFLLKLPQDITHHRAFAGTEEAERIFYAGTAALGERHAGILVQLPPHFGAENAETLYQFLQRRDTSVRFFLEFRHESWFRAQHFAEFERLGVAVAAVDGPFIPPAYTARILARPTTDFGYLRLLGVRGSVTEFDKRVHPRDAELAAWAERIGACEIADLCITSSNFYEGHAPATIRALLAHLGVAHRPRPLVTQPGLF